MKKQNAVERLNYSGGLIGLIAGSSKGKLQSKAQKQMVGNQNNQQNQK